MADKNRTFAAPAKSSKIKRPATTSSTRNLPNASAIKDKGVSRPKVNKNMTVIGDSDVTVRQDTALHMQIAYGKFLRAMLEDCLVDEKIAREEKVMDIQMAQLADRFKKTMVQLDRTNRRVKDISYMVEQKRLLDMKLQDCENFYEITDNANIQDTVDNLRATEQACLDKLETKNVDFGYNMETGHKQLLDAVNEAIDGLDRIKRHSNLDLQKFKEYSQAQTHLKELEKDRIDLEGLKTEFDDKFPKFSEKLLKEASEKIALMVKSDVKSDDV